MVVHNTEHVRAALDAARSTNRPVTLVSAPGAGHYLGAGYFRAMVEQGAGSRKDTYIAGIVLDCGDRPGTALAALRAGLPAIRLRARGDILDKVTEIARRQGAAVNPKTGPELNLLDARDPCRTCREWLARTER